MLRNSFLLGLIFVLISANDPLVSIKSTPSSTYELEGVINKMQVLFQIDTGVTKKTTRLPFELCVVLDNSGSMIGDKLENSKKAIEEIVKNMIPGDIFQFVVYSNDARVEVQDGTFESRYQIISKIRSIEAEGSTNLYSGLSKGLDLMTKKIDSGTRKNKRIFLFSDGLVNMGITGKPEILSLVRTILANGITVGSFGIGNGFDEDLMTSIAEHGSGEYFFLDNAESIPKLVAKATQGYLTLIGTEATLHVYGRGGSIVTKAFGHPMEELTKGLKLKDLRESDSVKLLIEMDVIPDQPDILEYELTYKPVGETELKRIRGKVTVRSTRDPSKIVRNKEVDAMYELQQMVEIDEEILRLQREGKIKEATEKKEKVVAMLEDEKFQDYPEAQVQLRRSKKILEDMKNPLEDQENVMRKQKMYNLMNYHPDKYKSEL